MWRRRTQEPTTSSSQMTSPRSWKKVGLPGEKTRATRTRARPAVRAGTTQPQPRRYPRTRCKWKWKSRARRTATARTKKSRATANPSPPAAKATERARPGRYAGWANRPHRPQPRLQRSKSPPSPGTLRSSLGEDQPSSRTPTPCPAITALMAIVRPDVISILQGAMHGSARGVAPRAR